MTAAVIFLAAVLAIAVPAFIRSRSRPRYHALRELEPGWQEVRQVLGDQARDMPPVHMCPPAEGEFVTPCCGVTPFDLPAGERITLRREQVTCRGYPTESE